MSGTKFKVLIASTRATQYSDDMTELLPHNCQLIGSKSRREEDLIQLIGDVDILVTVQASRKVIEKAKKLKLIQALGTGVDGIDIDAATKKGIVVCNAVGLNAVPVAEHTVSLMLALAKNLVRYDNEVKSGSWRTQSIPIRLLRRKTLGIVGLGSIGVEVAKRARAFGMRIIAIKRHPSEELRSKLGLEFLGGKNDLPYIMKESDFLVLSVVFTPETRKLIGESELRVMKRSAYLVNISRGTVIDETALIKVLQEGCIAGAGLDVFEVEPINPDNPLLKLDNVVLTPHIAGGMGIEELRKERVKFIAENIKKMIGGQKPENIVDPTLKYVIKK